MNGWSRLGDLLSSVFDNATAGRTRPHYSPPYDSPIEDMFAWHMVKYVAEIAAFVPQAEVRTVCGGFRIDFVVAVAGRRVGFECDGAAYHDEARDELRDALILFDARAVDSLFRLRGTDIHYRMPDLVYLLACYEPGIFSERAKAQIPRLASEAVIRGAAHADYRGALLRYGRDEDRRRGVMEYLRLQRRAVDADPRAFRFEKQFVAFAQALGGGNLDETIARWHERLMHGAA